MKGFLEASQNLLYKCYANLEADFMAGSQDFMAFQGAGAVENVSIQKVMKSIGLHRTCVEDQ